MKINVFRFLVSAPGHRTTAGIYNYLFLPAIPYSLCPWQAPQTIVVLGTGDDPKVSSRRVWMWSS